MTSKLYDEVKSKVKEFSNYNYNIDDIYKLVELLGGKVIVTNAPDMPDWENVAVYKSGNNSFYIEVKNNYDYQLKFDIICGIGKIFNLGYKINEDAWKNIVQEDKMYCPGYTEFIFGCAAVMNSENGERVK